MNLKTAAEKASKPIRILLADDHPAFRLGLAHILNMEGEMEVVGQAGSGDEAIDLYRQQRPTVTLMDLKMPGQSGIDAVGAIRREFPSARIIIVTASERDEDIYRSIRAGAMGYLVKDMSCDEILQAIRAVCAGRKHYPHRISERLAERLMMPELSERELEVLKLMALGRSNQKIAEALSLSLGTIKYHVNNIYGKLSADDRTQAVLTALSMGFADL